MKEACDTGAVEETGEFAMAPLQLECPMGSAACQYKTQEVELASAMQLMEMHRQMAHPQQVQTPTTSQVKTGKIVRPRLELRNYTTLYICYSAASCQLVVPFAT